MSLSLSLSDFVGIEIGIGPEIEIVAEPLADGTDVDRDTDFNAHNS